LRSHHRLYSVIGVAFFAVLLLSVFSLHAQSDAIDVIGSVTAFTQGTLLVDDHVVDITTAAVIGSPVVGSHVHIIGLSQNGIIVASRVEIVLPGAEATEAPEETEEPAETETPAPDGDIIVIVGPVTSIHDNVIVIYAFNILVDPNHPMLHIIQVGDIIRVEGALGDDDVITAIVIGNVLDEDEDGTVIIQGPVQTVNINIVTINNITIQLDPADPILIGLHPGDVIEVHGDFVIENNIYILVVINVIVIQDIDIHIGGGGGGGGDDDDDGGGMGMGDDDDD
jgi:hypothetical protein